MNNNDLITFLNENNKFSDFEKEICQSLHLFISHFNSLNLKEKELLEIISIAFYGGKFISKSESQLIDTLFNKYIDKCIDYYSNSLSYNYDINNTLHIPKEEILNHIQKEREIYDNISYISELHKITMFLKNKYMLHNNKDICYSNPNYNNLFIEKYIGINCLKYIQYLIIGEYLDDFSSLFAMYNNGNYITKNKVIELYHYCQENKCETSFLHKLSKNSNSNILEYIDNILKNVIKTPYYYEAKYKEYFENMILIFSNTMENIINPENYQLFAFIQQIKENIVKKGIESKDLIDIEYPNICITEIMNNKLNVNEFTSKTFFEYFMTSKAEAKLAITLENTKNTLDTALNK